MAKKAATQVIEALQAARVNEIDGTVTIPVDVRDRCVRLLKAVNKRDEEYRAGKNPNAKKKAAKRK